MKSGDAPQAPNPAVSIPLQGAENRRSFDYQLGQMRTNTQGPTGSTSWSKTPTFDEAGYNKALADFQSRQGDPSTSGQTWVPGSPGGGDFQDPNTGNIISSPASAGHWETNPNGSASVLGTAPDKSAFTNYDWTQTTTLSPEQQALFDTNQRMQGNLSHQAESSLANPLDLSSLPGIGRSQSLGNEADQYYSGLADRSLGDNFSTGLSDAAYRQQTRYLDPQQEQEKSKLAASLADQGFVPGTPGYDQAMRNFSDTSNRAYGAARDSAIGQGYQQGNTQLQLQTAIAQALSGKQGAAFGQDTGLRSQALQELLTQRSQPINELAAIKSGNPIGMPQGTGQSQTPNLGATDIMGALNQQYQGQLGGYNADVSSANATTGAGIGGLAAVLAAFV